MPNGCQEISERHRRREREKTRRTKKIHKKLEQSNLRTKIFFQQDYSHLSMDGIRDAICSLFVLYSFNPFHFGISISFRVWLLLHVSSMPFCVPVQMPSHSLLFLCCRTLFSSLFISLLLSLVYVPAEWKPCWIISINLSTSILGERCEPINWHLEAAQNVSCWLFCSWVFFAWKAVAWLISSSLFAQVNKRHMRMLL